MKEYKFYLNKIEKSKIPKYWQYSQNKNLFIAEYLFDNIRSGIFHSYHPISVNDTNIYIYKLERLLVAILKSKYLYKRIRMFFHKIKLRSIRKQLSQFAMSSFIGENPMIPQMTLACIMNKYMPDIFEYEDSMIGNPLDSFYLNGKPFTYEFIEKFYRSELMKEHISRCANKEEYIVEIGGSFGLQIEVLKKRFGKRYILIETPAQAYAAYKYLKAVFPKSNIIGSHQTENEKLFNSDIIILTNDQLDIISKHNIKVKCLINQRSFQEMEWEFVDEYLDFFTKKEVDSIHLWQMEDGHPLVEEDKRTTVKKIENKLNDKYSSKRLFEFSRFDHDFSYYSFECIKK